MVDSAPRISGAAPLQLLVSLPARAASGLVWVYQRTLSPALTAAFPSCGCRFAPTCSHYARTALQEHGFLAGTALTIARLAKCGPWHPGGEDPVPTRPRPVCQTVIHAPPPGSRRISIS